MVGMDSSRPSSSRMLHHGHHGHDRSANIAIRFSLNRFRLLRIRNKLMVHAFNCLTNVPLFRMLSLFLGPPSVAKYPASMVSGM